MLEELRDILFQKLLSLDKKSIYISVSLFSFNCLKGRQFGALDGLSFGVTSDGSDMPTWPI